MIGQQFEYDVFLSHSSKDKPAVRKLAERLRGDGLKVWFDEWVLLPGDDIYLKIEQGTEESRVLVLVMSAGAFGSDWVSLERSTGLFRDPANQQRRFVPVLLADCKIPDVLRRYKYIDFRQDEEEASAYGKLLAACQTEHAGLDIPTCSRPSRDDEGGDRDPWIVKTLDHVRQAKPLRDRLGAPGAPSVAVVEGCTDDLPNYLADDVFLDPWPAFDDIPQDATTLNPARYGADESAFWSAVHHCLPATQQATERDKEQEAVRVWLRARNRHLFYLSLSMADDGFRLPHLIRAAKGFLAELSRREPGMRLLLLIACQPRQERPPWWWPLWRGWCRKRLPDDVLWLAPLRPLERTDINAWYDGFSSDVRRTLYRGRLRDELLDLFEGGRAAIQYRHVRRLLLEDGALERARSRR